MLDIVKATGAENVGEATQLNSVSNLLCTDPTIRSQVIARDLDASYVDQQPRSLYQDLMDLTESRSSMTVMGGP